MLNLTPHSIHIYDPKSEKTLVIPASGTVARVLVNPEERGFVAIEGLPVPFSRDEFGIVTGLPEDGQNCIVSGMVLQALKNDPQGVDLSTVFAPDTGPTAIRNEQGQITAVTRLKSAI